MDYLKAVLKKDEEQKIIELKKIIALGEKLNKNVTPDKKKLEILLGRQIKKEEKIVTEKNKSTINNSSIENTFSIKSVYTSKNQIFIDFDKDINKNDIKYFELNQNPIYKDVFDMNGSFKDAIPTKLDIEGVDKITLGQFKSDVLRVVLSHNKNLNTSYNINKRQIIITIHDLEKKEKKDNVINIGKKITPVVEEKKEEKIIEDDKYIDTKNSIRSIKTNQNNILVKFNKDYYKKDIRYINYKHNNKYEYVFDISGKFEYVMPTVLNIEGIEKIIVTENGSNIVRIRLINKDKLKINYNIGKRELTISTVPNIGTKQNKIATTVPQRRIINKTVVIDAGHGGDDVGAVGENKRYEKVVNLNVSKYLYSILKERGYKVYLTRTNDTFIKVMNRTILANDKNADIFISIHTNSVPKSKANQISGIETFFLSPARSERAKRVAALENKSDIREMSNSSKSVFLESLNRPRITASHKLAIDVQAGLLQSAKTKYKDINDSGVREGPFWVLVGAQMPSILVELGYISHPTESKRLYNKEYQQLLANGIANGVDSYFLKNP